MKWVVLLLIGGKGIGSLMAGTAWGFKRFQLSQAGQHRRLGQTGNRNRGSGLPPPISSGKFL